MKKPAKPAMIRVPESTVFFPTPDDPKGIKHVAQKFLEAEAAVNLLVTAIARSEINIALLDLPKASELLKIHAEHMGNPTYPGPSVVMALVEAIQATKNHLDETRAEFMRSQNVILPQGLRLVKAQREEAEQQG
jgi:hypothetical protein